jgi:formylglycine-generating enzyme required for sulfatase activity
MNQLMINKPWLNCLVLYSLFTVLLVGCDSKDTGDNTKAGVIDAEVLTIKQVLVPAGKFIRGSNKEDDPDMRQRYGFPAPLYLDEHPEKSIYLDAFKIDTYEVTNRQYKDYLLKTRTMLPYLWMSNGYTITKDQLNMLEKDKLQKMALDVFMLDIDTRAMDKTSIVNAIMKKQSAQDDLPVSGISWFAAKAYCEWRKGRLPLEAEWEKAARGPDGLEYPWGNMWDPGITNTGDDGKWDEGMAPVGSYKNNQSPYGAYDMAGNAWEWVEDWYLPYEGSSYTTDAFGQINKVLRGGGGGVGHYAISYFFRAATRQFSEPEMESEDVGFRCVTDL